MTTSTVLCTSFEVRTLNSIKSTYSVFRSKYALSILLEVRTIVKLTLSPVMLTHHTIQFSTVHCSKGTVPYGAVRYIAVQCRGTIYNLIQYYVTVVSFLTTRCCYVTCPRSGGNAWTESPASATPHTE